VAPTAKVGYLGPQGTFTEEALLTQPDLAAAQLVPLGSIPDVLAATAAGEIDYGFAAIENAIEGSVNVTLDTLAFDTELLVQREVVIRIQLNLLVRPGVALDDLTTVVSFPHATAQCRQFLTAKLGGVQTQAANSTAEAARLLAAEEDPAVWKHTAAIGTSRAGEVYGLKCAALDIEDHPETETRFVLVAQDGVPRPTGHDKTSLVVFQKADVPGSLLAILQEFAARNINLTKLESRPTKRGLGDYCFLMDLDGHVSDEVVGDCLRSLKIKQADVKFLGSYPAAGEEGHELRREAVEAWRNADAWLTALRGGSPGA
jgi:prephenate dehydratase